ncbi:MAG: hypothetical protein JW760_14000 [Spirochaetales bacterium]|nr:hypothetical protein [Spirochaetales bacterium]
MKRVNVQKTILAVITGVLLLTAVESCNFFGPFDNPVDPEAENWQGFFSISLEDLSIGACSVVCATTDGGLFAWGSESYGQLGIQYLDARDYYPPKQIPSLSGVHDVVGGENVNYARDESGNLWGWGNNEQYQLGTEINGGIVENDSIHRPILLDTDITMMDAAGEYALRIKADGSLYMWGRITHWESSEIIDFMEAEPVLLETDLMISKIACGSKMFIVLADDGTVWRYGYWDEVWHDSFDQISELSGIEDISSSSDQFIAEGSDGTLWTWGNYGGYPPLLDATDTPVLVPVIASGFSSIAAGDNCGLAITGDGVLYGWGSNRYGQLGLPPWQFVLPEPVRIDTEYPGHDFTGGRVFSGSGATFAWAADGSLFAWGENDEGLLGLNKPGAPDMDLSEYIVDFGSAGPGITAADGGEYFGVAVDGDGFLWTWGYNAEGQLGLGDTDFRQEPVKISGLPGFDTVSSGRRFTVARDSGGSLWAWGNNPHGELGLGDNTDRLSPVEISGFGSSPILRIECGLEHTLALDEAEYLWVWGRNYNGQLGLGDNDDHYTPDEITSFDAPVVDIACGPYHSLALDLNGVLWAWGSNNYGQLGDGTTVDRNMPVQVDSSVFGNLAVTALAAGDCFSVAVTEDGCLWGWGNDCSLGLGSGDAISTPIQLTGPENIQSLSSTSSGYFFTTRGGLFYYRGVHDIDSSSMFYGVQEKLFDPAGNETSIYGSDLWSNRGLTYIEGGYGHFFLIDESGVLYAF